MIDIWIHRASYFVCGLAFTVAALSPCWLFLFASLAAAWMGVSAVIEDLRQIAAFKRPLHERDMIKNV